MLDLVRVVPSASAKQCLLSQYRWISSNFSCKSNRIANTRTPTVNPRRGRFDTEKPLERERRPEIQREQRSKRRRQQTAEQKQHHSMNFECWSNFKRKLKRFWTISLKIWANIAVTKHVFLADEFINRFKGLCNNYQEGASKTRGGGP